MRIKPATSVVNIKQKSSCLKSSTYTDKSRVLYSKILFTHMYSRFLIVHVKSLVVYLYI